MAAVPPSAPVVGFDLDLTLVDSTDGIVATLAAAVAASPGGEGVTIGRAEVWPWVGHPLEATVAALAPRTDTAQVCRTYRAAYAATGVPLTRLLPGAREALAAVHAAGGRVLVVSAKAEAGVRAVLARVGLDAPDLAPDLVAGGRFADAKGELLRAEGAHVYVGDHSGDVRAARVAGAVSVAVVTGPEGRDVLTAAGADVVLDDLRPFPAWLAGSAPGLARSRPSR